LALYARACKYSPAFKRSIVTFEHASDIKRLYLKTYGVPPANTRIVIRAGQPVEGRECRGRMRLTDALVPARAWVLRGQQAKRTGGKKG